MRAPAILHSTILASLRIPVFMAAAVLVWPAGSGHAAGSPLADAARDGELAPVTELIAQGADVNLAASDGSTALLWAAYHHHAEMAQALLAAGADPDVPNNFGVTPLVQASRTGDAAVMEVLLDGGADITLAHPEGLTPLMAAAGTGRLDTVRLLLDRGADPNAADSFQNQTALMWAAAEGHLDVVDTLLLAGADPDAQARFTELTKRSDFGDYPSGGFTAMMWAVRNGNEDIVRRLVEAGADLNLRNGDDATAMMIAVVNDRFDLAAVLLELGADPDDGSLYHAVQMRDATTDWYARDGSQLRANHDNELTALDLVAVLLEAGADPDKPLVQQMHSAEMCCDTYNNGTAFYRAAVAADVEALKLLIAQGVDVTWMPEEIEGLGMSVAGMGANAHAGKPALIAAINGGKGVRLSAGPGYNREGPPPFRELSNREPADAVQLLLDAGADPDAAMPEDKTFALHEAVRTRNLGTIGSLIDAGATLDLKDEDGLTALHVAEALPTEAHENVFEPGRISVDGATPDEIANVLRTAMEAAGVPIEPAPEPAEDDADEPDDA